MWRKTKRLMWIYHRQYRHGLKTCFGSLLCLFCACKHSADTTKTVKQSKLINLMYDIESHLTGQTEPIWPQSMPITQKYLIYHFFVTWLFSARRIGDWIKLLSPGNIWGRFSRINVIFFTLWLPEEICNIAVPCQNWWNNISKDMLTLEVERTMTSPPT